MVPLYGICFMSVNFYCQSFFRYGPHQKCHSILEETMEYKTNIGREGLQLQYLLSVRSLIYGNSCHAFIACVTRLDPLYFCFFNMLFSVLNKVY